MSLPRTPRIASSSRPSRSTPSSLIEPPTIRPGGFGTSRMSESAVTLLPQPDSPTIASVSPAASEKLIPSTALMTPRREDVAERVAEQVGTEDREADGNAGKYDQPRRGAHVFRRRFRQHPAPGRVGLGNAESEERQRRLGQDRGSELGGREHDQRRQRIGQDVHDGDAEFAHAYGSRRLDEGQLA